MALKLDYVETLLEQIRNIALNVRRDIKPETIRFGIVGSRSFPRDFGPSLCHRIMDEIYSVESDAIVVSGRSLGGGPDIWAEKHADWLGKLKDIYPPIKGDPKSLWTRNTSIAQRSDFLIAMWDEKTTGTKDSVQKTSRLKKPVIIIHFDGTWRVINDRRLR